MRPDERGRLRITPSGNLRLPATIRHRCQLQAGERLLLVADPDEGQLRLYSPTTLNHLIGHHGAGPNR